MVTKATKEKTVEELKTALLNSTITVVSDYQGTSVGDLTQLRRDIQKAGGDLKIAKNTLIKFAVKENEDISNALSEYLVGPTAVAYTNEDPVAVAKAMNDYITKNKKTKIKGGYLEGKQIDEEGIKALASLPSKEELIAKLLGSMNSPAQGLVMALSGVSRNLVNVLDAIKKQKEQG